MWTTRVLAGPGPGPDGPCRYANTRPHCSAPHRYITRLQGRPRVPPPGHAGSLHSTVDWTGIPRYPVGTQQEPARREDTLQVLWIRHLTVRSTPHAPHLSSQVVITALFIVFVSARVPARRHDFETPPRSSAPERRPRGERVERGRGDVVTLREFKICSEERRGFETSPVRMNATPPGRVPVAWRRKGHLMER